jgi:hypothetical protein
MDKFPLGLKKLPRWVPYKLVEKDGKVSPIPHQLNGKPASSTDPHTWTTFEKATAVLPTGYSGLQIAIEPPFVGIDLDHCRDANTGVVEDWAKAALAQLNSYTEFSPSGTGFHVFVTGTLPPNGNRCGRVEIYGTKKLFRVTGRHVPGYPLDVNPCDCAAFHSAFIAGGKGKPWDTVPAAATPGGASSDSDKEWAVVCRLIEKLGPNAAAVEAEFRATQPHREKHDKMRGPVTYLRYTIDNAIKRVGPAPQPLSDEQIGDDFRDAETPLEKAKRLMGQTIWTPTGPVAPAHARVSFTQIVYPYWAWEGTPYHEFAERCVAGNHIPRAFFVETLKTVVGAICGHRLKLVDNAMDARFYTVILSKEGGVGKSTGLEWVLGPQLFGPTELLYRGNPKLQNIGCHYGGFGSGVGMLKRFRKSPRVLQTYDEIAVMVEKLGIKGSGQGFLGVLNSLYDSNIVPSNEVKDTDFDEALPPKVWNSIVGLSIKAKWDEMFAETSADNSGFFQRLNLVAADDIKTVARLKEPNLTTVRDALLQKIMPLEHRIMRLEISAEADQLLEGWFGDFKIRSKGLPADVTGRINVLIERNAMQIAWLLSNNLDGLAPTAPPPTDADGVFGPGISDALPIETAAPGAPLQISKDVMIRAIALGEYQWLTRLANRPASGRNETARLEGTIEKQLQKSSPQSRRELYRAIHGTRFGIHLFNAALGNMEAEGLIRVVREAPVAGQAPGGRQRDTIHWVGN